MPHFYFHLATPTGREIDDIGSPCPTADHAMLEAWRAVFEICTDLIRAGRAPYGHRFEVCDAAGRLVFELPFSDVTGARAERPRGVPDVLKARLAVTIQRSRTLRAEVSAAMLDVQATLATTRALLALPQ